MNKSFLFYVFICFSLFGRFGLCVNVNVLIYLSCVMACDKSSKFNIVTKHIKLNKLRKFSNTRLLQNKVFSLFLRLLFTFEVNKMISDTLQILTQEADI